MASSFVVISTDLRRTTVKVPTGSYMIDVLEEACSKLKLNSEVYQLKHNNKPINLTDPVRAAGLTQGAKLELVVKSKSPSAVTVALRLPESETRLGIPNNRVTAKVRNDTPLWKLLRHFEESDEAKQRGLNITARGVPRTSHTGSATGAAVGSGSGQLYWETPVLKFAGRELTSLDDFRKTLAQVGIDTGSQLIILEFRTCDLTLQEAMEAVQQKLEKADADAAADKAAAKTASSAPVPAPEPTAAAIQSAGSVDTSAIPAAVAQETTKPEIPPEPTPPVPQRIPSTSEAMDVDMQHSKEGPERHPSAHLQPVRVWLPPKAGAGMPAAAALRWGKETDATFAPSIAQMKAHQKHLEEAGRNKRLKSDSEIEEEAREREAKAAAVNKVDVRIRFPDGYAVMWSFPNGATGATLHTAVRGVLADHVQQQPFRLATPMSRSEIQDSTDDKHDLVRGYGMRGGVVVNFLRGADVPSPPSNRSYIRDEVIAMAEDIVIAQPVTDEEEDEQTASSSRPANHGQDGQRTNKGGDAVNKMAKFLRLSKK